MSSKRIRSALVSLFTAGLETALLCGLSILVSGPILVLARWIGGLVGGGLNYGLNRWWVFGRGAGRPSSEGMKQMGRFGATAVGSVTISTTVWVLLYTVTGADPRVLHPVAMMLVWLVFTFPVLKLWVFRESRVQPADGETVQVDHMQIAA